MSSAHALSSDTNPPLPATAKNEDKLKNYLESIRTVITNTHMAAFDLNDRIQPLAQELPHEIITVEGRIYRLLKKLDVEDDPSPDGNDPEVQRLIEMLRSVSKTCALVRRGALSIESAKWMDSTLAAVQFTIFDQPYGISTWVDWTYHRREASQTDLCRLQEVAGWWRNVHKQGEFMVATGERNLADLEREYGIFCRMNRDYDWLSMTFFKVSFSVPLSLRSVSSRL
jgi:hypothetical protein